MKLSTTVLATVLFCCVSESFAVTNVWQGASATNGVSTYTNTDNAAYWSLGRIPDTNNNDVALFVIRGTNLNDVFVPEGGVFAPSALFFDGNASASVNDLYIDRSQTLEWLKMWSFGATSGGGTSQWDSRLRFGTLSVSPITITLTGNGEVLDMTQNNAAWRNFVLGTGKVTLDFTGTNITFSQRQQRFGMEASSSGYPMTGGTAVENPTCTLNSTIRFSGSNATIRLADQGIAGSSLNLGYHNLAVRSDQTWIADPAAYIWLFSRVGTNNNLGPELIQSIDGGRLDNLGRVNVCVNRQTGISTTSNTAARLRGGTYGSLRLQGAPGGIRYCHVKLSGDVTLAGNAVNPPTATNSPATPTIYGLYIDGDAGGFVTEWTLITDSRSLMVSNGVYLVDGTPLAGLPMRAANIWCEGSTVTVGGDILIRSLNFEPGNPTGTNAHTVGFQGDGSSVFNFKGNYETRCAYLTGNGFCLSTVNLIGGSGVKTVEVACAASQVAVTSNSCAINVLNVGNGVTAGNVRLVNNYQNDNPTVVTNAAVDKAGEKLLVNTLGVKAGSTLDVNAQQVRVCSSLTVAADAWLDLKTGLSLTNNQVITSFVGSGDQTAAWNVSAARVKDSGQPNFAFQAVSNAGNTYWQAYLPTPHGLLIICK